MGGDADGGVAEALLRGVARMMPLNAAHALRDGSLIANILDFGGILGLHHGLSLAATHRVNKTDFLNISYGEKKREKLDVYTPQMNAMLLQIRVPVLVFVHGGAWGTGHRRMYSLLGKRLRNEGFCVMVASYPTYPVADAENQIDAVSKILGWAVQNVGKFNGDADAIFLCGHSSGAHICAMHILRCALQKQKGAQVKGFIGLSGVYNIREHYEFERQRNVHELSFMKPACGGEAMFDAISPSLIASTLSPDCRLPPILLCHGDNDTTVPLSSSERFAASLLGAGVHAHVELERLLDTDHFVFLLPAMLGWDSTVIDRIVVFCGNHLRKSGAPKCSSRL